MRQVIFWKIYAEIFNTYNIWLKLCTKPHNYDIECEVLVYQRHGCGTTLLVICSPAQVTFDWKDSNTGLSLNYVNSIVLTRKVRKHYVVRLFSRGAQGVPAIISTRQDMPQDTLSYFKTHCLIWRRIWWSCNILSDFETTCPVRFRDMLCDTFGSFVTSCSALRHTACKLVTSLLAI